MTVVMSFVDLLPPAGDGVLVRGFTDFLEDGDHFGQHVVHRVNDRDIGFDGLGDRSRVDVDMDDLGVRAELGRAVDYTVIEARTDR